MGSARRRAPTRPPRAPLAAVLLAALAGAACASERPWKVRPGDEARYSRSVETCKELTDDAAGFETCMKRRGWRREYPGGL